MISNLLKILSDFYISDNIPVTGILKQIIINEEFKILKMFMDADDKIGENSFSLKFLHRNQNKNFLSFSVRETT